MASAARSPRRVDSIDARSPAVDLADRGALEQHGPADPPLEATAVEDAVARERGPLALDVAHDEDLRSVRQPGLDGQQRREREPASRRRERVADEDAGRPTGRAIAEEDLRALVGAR